jgi:hypothetical protein
MTAAVAFVGTMLAAPTGVSASTTPIKSVTVTLPSGVTVLDYGSCSGGSSAPAALGFPNATCSTAQYTVTSNGNTSEQIDVQGSIAQPSDGSASVWQLCDPTVSPCAGAQPGPDQYENLVLGSSASVYLTAAPREDAAFGTSTVAPGQSATETLRIIGPQSSTDQSQTFSMTVSYTAV